jgi:hypothetical protein
MGWGSFFPSPAGDAGIRTVPTPDARRGTETKENPQKMFGLLRVLEVLGFSRPRTIFRLMSFRTTHLHRCPLCLAKGRGLFR